MKILLVFVLIISPFFTTNVLGCSCWERYSMYLNFSYPENIFTGTVVSSKDVNNERNFKVLVNESFKGNNSKEVEINLGDPDNMCYGGLFVDVEYLFYAVAKDGKLRTSYCFGTAPLELAEDELYFIREILKGVPESQIYGSVKWLGKLPDSLIGKTAPFKGVKIILQGEENNFETEVREDGIYKFDNIPDGIYELKGPLTNYKVLDSYSFQTKMFEIKNGKIKIDDGEYSGFFSSFLLDWDNSIEGNVFDANGILIKAGEVKVIPVSNPFAEIDSYSLFLGLGESGYTISGENPGKYYLVAEIFAPFGKTIKHRIFYPQAKSPEKATPIDLKENDKLKFDFILPADFKIKKLKGQVLFSDGQPAYPHVILLSNSKDFSPPFKDSYDDRSYSEESNFDYTISDQDGNFELEAFEGAEYWIHAWDYIYLKTINKEKLIQFKVNPVKINVGKDNQQIKIIVLKPDKSDSAN